MKNKSEKMLEELKKELEKCEKLWSKYSFDCLYFEIISLKKIIAEWEK